MADTKRDGNEGRVNRLEHHDELIEVFVDLKRNMRNMKTATKEVMRLTGLSEDVARMLARDMKRSVQKEGAMVFRNGTRYPDNILRGRIAAGLKVPYNIATSYGERNDKDKSEEERD